MAETTEKAKKAGPRFPRYFCIGTTLFVIFLAVTGSFYNMDRRWTDAMFAIRGMEECDKRIVIVTIDDESLKKVGSYPWKRGVYRRLIKGLFQDKVKAIGVDVMFPDPSPLPDEDAQLVQAARDYGDKVAFGINLSLKTGETEMSVDRMFPALDKVAKHQGSVFQEAIDTDGAVRRVLLFNSPKTAIDWDEYLRDEGRIPSLALSTLSMYLGKTPDELAATVGTNSFWLNLRGQRFYLAQDGTERYDYGIPRIPAWKVLEDKLEDAERDRLKEAVVLVGFTAVGSFDHYPTAFHESVPGVEVHANILDNVLNGRWMRSISPLFTLVMVIPMVLLARWLVTRPPVLAGVGLLGALGLWYGGTYAAFLKLAVVDSSAPVVALVVTFLALMVHRAMLEVQQKREVRQMFGQYVAPEIVEILVKDPDKLKLGGERRDMTMFFLDIAHFTTISEKMKAENLIQFLNTYLTALTDDILRNHGVVDKYIGDCIMAFWNAPIDDPKHRLNACLAAAECIKTMQRLNKEYVDPSIPERPAVRIGLNSGEVVVGNTGSARKLQYTVLGDEVNLASRLEGANKFFGSTVMASEGTYKGAEEFVEARVLGSVRVVGKEIPIKVFELLGRKGDVSAEWMKALPFYHGGVDKFLKGEFEKAAAEFQEVLKLIPGDKPSKLYLNVCQDYVTIPPQGDWKVFNLTSK